MRLPYRIHTTTPKVDKTEHVTRDWIWGKIPPSFKKVVDEFGNCLAVREDQRGSIVLPPCLGKNALEESSRFQGRGKLRSLKLPNGHILLVRPYLHGGLFGGITGRVFFTWPPRPFRELAITEKLRQRGIPTVEVYAAYVERVWGPFYRGWIVTRELTGAQDVWTALTSGYFQELGADKGLRAIAVSLRALHREGVYHSDLNLKNILIRPEAGGVMGYIIDFDKAKLFSGHLPAELVKRNLDRLLRSVRKLDPERRHFPEKYWRELLECYDKVREHEV